MRSSSRFSTHHVPDDGTRYAPGETVRIDHSSGRIQIIKDPTGDHEVVTCRPATEYGESIPLLRLNLRKGALVSIEDITWAPQRLHRR